MAFRRWKPTEIEQTRHSILTSGSLLVNGSSVVGVCVIFFGKSFLVFSGNGKAPTSHDRYSVDLGVQPDQFLFNKLISICAKSKVRKFDSWLAVFHFSVDSWFYCEFFWDWKLLNWQEGLSESQHFVSDFVTTELAYNSLEFVGLPGTCLEACANGVYFQMC